MLLFYQAHFWKKLFDYIFRQSFEKVDLFQNSSSTLQIFPFRGLISIVLNWRPVDIHKFRRLFIYLLQIELKIPVDSNIRAVEFDKLMQVSCEVFYHLSLFLKWQHNDSEDILFKSLSLLQSELLMQTFVFFFGLLKVLNLFET